MQTAHIEFQEVYDHAKRSIKFQLAKYAQSLSTEIKEEIFQTAMIRVWKAYQALNPSMAWHAFIEQHCRGAVLDFIKSGRFDDGFTKDVEPACLSRRIDIMGDDNTPLSVEEVVGILGAYQHEPEAESFNPKWELLSRLVVYDVNLHILAKTLYKYTHEEITRQHNLAHPSLSRERIGQRVRDFLQRLDSPKFIDCPFTKQSIYALGLCKKFHMPETDFGYGWNIPAVNIRDADSFVHAIKIVQSSAGHQLAMRDILGDVENIRVVRPMRLLPGTAMLKESSRPEIEQLLLDLDKFNEAAI